MSTVNADSTLFEHTTFEHATVNPSDVVIVGLDTSHVEGEHPLWDERTVLPVDEALVLSIMESGVLQAITLRRNGEDLEVVFGRRRVRAAREANTRLVEAGREPLVLNAIIRTGSDREMLAIMITENSLRKGDGPLEKSRALKRLLALDYSLKECSVFFGVTENAVKNWKKLLDADDRLIEAVHNGEIKASAVINLAALPKEEQYAKFLELQGLPPEKTASAKAEEKAEATAGAKPQEKGPATEAGTKTDPKGKKGKKITTADTRNVRREAAGSKHATAVKPPRKPVLTSIIEYAEKAESHSMSADAIDVLKWTLGKIPASSVPGLEEMLKQVTVSKKGDELSDAQKGVIVAMGSKHVLYSDVHKKIAEALINRGLLQRFEDKDGTDSVKLTKAGKLILAEIVATTPAPTSKGKGKSGSEASSEPAAEANSEPVVEANSEPVVEASAEPVVEASAEPMVEASSEPAAEASSEPVVEANAEPATEESITIQVNPKGGSRKGKAKGKAGAGAVA